MRTVVISLLTILVGSVLGWADGVWRWAVIAVTLICLVVAIWPYLGRLRAWIEGRRLRFSWPISIDRRELGSTDPDPSRAGSEPGAPGDSGSPDLGATNGTGDGSASRSRELGSVGAQSETTVTSARPDPKPTSARVAAAEPWLKDDLRRLLAEGEAIRQHSSPHGVNIYMSRTPEEWEEEVRYVLAAASRPDLEAEFASAIRTSSVFTGLIGLVDKRAQMTQRVVRLRNILNRM